MVSFLNWLAEKLMARSRKPWARFIVNGIDKNNQVRFDISFNKAFIRNLDKQGLTGANDEETVNNFLFGTFMAPKGVFDELMSQEPVQSAAHPNLQAETNVLRKG